MRLFLGILALWALFLCNAQAQSQYTSNWTEKYYSEENANEPSNLSFPKYVGYYMQNSPSKPAKMGMEFLSGVQCRGSYCDDKRFKFTGGFQVPTTGSHNTKSLSLHTFTVSTPIPFAPSLNSAEQYCPEGEYITHFSCEKG